jgi:hypothetical protein
MSPNGKLENKFDYFLMENDLFYGLKIKFEISHSNLNQYYKIKILPAIDGSDSQEYFKNNFESGIGREKLEKFKRENNVGIVIY